MLWGSNARAAHPIFFHHVLKAIERGARLIVVDPRRTESAAFGDLWLGIDWQVKPSPVKPHGYKYSFVYIVKGKRISSYDNAEGKGDHRHYGDKEEVYTFKSVDKLFEDFYKDIKRVKEHES